MRRFCRQYLQVDSVASDDYFTVSHYLPEGVYQRRRNVAQLLRAAHAGRRGTHATDAEQLFVRHVQALKEYGLHLYSAVWVRSMSVVFIRSFVQLITE